MTENPYKAPNAPMGASRMKGIVAIASGLLAVASAVVMAGQADIYDWSRAATVEVDLDRNGRMDTAQLGMADQRVALRVTVNAKPMPLIDVPIDGSQHFGICPGSTPSIRVAAQSEAPLNALGEMPPGYEVCTTCMEIVVGGGACDALHFYWDTTTQRIAWWRA